MKQKEAFFGRYIFESSAFSAERCELYGSKILSLVEFGTPFWFGAPQNTSIVGIFKN